MHIFTYFTAYNVDYSYSSSCDNTDFAVRRTLTRVMTKIIYTLNIEVKWK